MKKIKDNINNTHCKEFILALTEIPKLIDFVSELIDLNSIKFIFLNGEIGSGKTTFTKFFAKHLKETKTITSPSFNKMFIYDKFVHIDAYNMDENELELFEDYFDEKIVIIEWADKLKNKINEKYINIDIQWESENNRSYLVCWKV